MYLNQLVPQEVIPLQRASFKRELTVADTVITTLEYPPNPCANSQFFSTENFKYQLYTNNVQLGIISIFYNVTVADRVKLEFPL